MKILQVHNGYSQRGGEDAVVAAEAALLESRGHVVDRYTVSNVGVGGMSWFGVGLRCGNNRTSMQAMASHIAVSRPDLVHVHNFFPLLSTAIYQPCAESNIPVVQTLHNYRPICLGANLTRDGRPCEQCVGTLPIRGIAHRCYKSSVLASAAGALMIASNARRDVWRRSVDRFIAPSNFTREKFAAAGFPRARIMVKPNFADGIWRERPRAARRAGALFVGRLSEEKGVRTMIEAAQASGAALRIVGDGPLADLCRRAGYPPAGPLGADEVRCEMLKAGVLVVPSECYEGFPVVIVEAFASGLPVIASHTGALAELIEDGRTGLLFSRGDAGQLSDRLTWAAAHADVMARMGEHARREYEDRFAAVQNYDTLLDIYRAAAADPSPERARCSKRCFADGCTV